MKKYLSLGLSLLMAVAFPMATSALTTNSDLSQSYTYSIQGYAMEAPAAYLPTAMIDATSLGLDAKMVPNDLFVGPDNRLYIVDTDNNAIHIVDENYNLVTSITELTGVTKPLHESVILTSGEKPDPNKLNKPSGVFVDDNGWIYIADTENMRVICVDETGKVMRELDTPDFTVAGEVAEYKPAKVALDKAGRIFVVGKAVNRGLLELNVDGSFKSFFGAPKVLPDMVEIFWRTFMTEEQIAKTTQYVPTEYNNIFIDTSGFVYATVGTVDADAMVELAGQGTAGNSSSIIPIKKLSPTGDDVLAKKGSFPPIGDVDFEKNNHSRIVDVVVQPNGMYSLLDGNHNRVFTYDTESNLLYIFGGTGTQFGFFQTASSLVSWNDHFVVSDTASGKITVFSITEYASLINEAIEYNYDGKYEECAESWRKALKYNSNLMVAYNGIGRALYWQGEPTEAMKNLEIVRETEYYSWAVGLQHKQMMEYIIPIAIIVIVVLIVGGMILSGIRKRKRRAQGGDE